MDLFGGIEAGGTKFVCGVGTGPDDLVRTEFPTTDNPRETIAGAVSWLRERAAGKLRCVGIAAFGPLDLNRSSATYGYITSTPKPGWANYDIRGAVADALGVPVNIDTDVNG